jgi:hypothetical protein
MRAIYESLGRHRDYIVKNYPDLMNYITASVEAFNKIVHTYQFKLLKNRIKEIIQKIVEKA